MAVAAILIAGGIYFAINSQSGNGKEKYKGISLQADPTGTSQFPRRNCFFGAEAIPGGDGARISLTAAFIIVNKGKELPPGSIYLIFNNEPILEVPFNQTYPSGATLFGGKRDFSFLSEFRGAGFSQMEIKRIYDGNQDLEYKLAYCIDCVDPVRDGLVFYSSTTQYCCRLPSTSVGNPASSCD